MSTCTPSRDGHLPNKAGTRCLVCGADIEISRDLVQRHDVVIGYGGGGAMQNSDVAIGYGSGSGGSPYQKPVSEREAPHCPTCECGYPPSPADHHGLTLVGWMRHGLPQVIWWCQPDPNERPEYYDVPVFAEVPK